jgi:hypothetical protein
MKQISVRVSDHALVRYFERAMGFDVEAVRAQIARQCAPAAALGAVSFRADGVQFVLDGHVVVTVTPAGDALRRVTALASGIVERRR